MIFQDFDQHFNPRTSCEVRRPRLSVPAHTQYFNPRTSCEVRPWAGLLQMGIGVFQSTHLLRGATAKEKMYLTLKEFQSTHLLRGATFCSFVSFAALLFQSTHLLRGATSIPAEARRWNIYFNPRTSCEVRLVATKQQAPAFVFQSTHLLRGATMLFGSIRMGKIFQSTHLLRGATLAGIWRAGTFKFQSTHLLRGATEDGQEVHAKRAISIHAPLARCDSC